MRAFWIIVGVLAVVVAVIAFRGGGDPAEDARAPSKTTPTVSAPTAVTASPSVVAPAPAIGPVPTPVSDAASGQGSRSATERSASDVESAGEALVDDLLESAKDRGGEDLEAALADRGDAQAASFKPGDAKPAADLPAFDPAQPVDGKYIVGGSGTADDPFQITWDLLLLTAQTYQPRLGTTDIPPQVKAVNGTHIKIAGYFAVPMASTDAREVLVMLNMWDGCCIGLPPSPCDAIEVRLKQPLPGAGKQYINYGTLTGTLQVDPFVQNGWLLGMYLVEDGELEVGM